MKIFDQFYDYLKNQKRYSEHTVKNYSLDLDKFKQYLIENNLTSLANLTEHDILNFLYAQAQEKSLSGTTINRKLSAIRHFFKY